MNVEQPSSTTASNDDAENTILDLQMTIVAMQTEQEVAMRNKEAESQNQIRSLQEQLRRLQNETNVLRSRQHQQSKKQPPAQSSFASFEKSIPLHLENSNEMTDNSDSPIKILPPLSPQMTNRNNARINDHSHRPLYYDFPSQSPGERLIHHLLLSHPQKCDSVYQQLEQDIERVLTRMLSSFSTTSSSVLSEWDVIQWFIMEIMHILSSTTNNPNVQTAGQSASPTTSAVSDTLLLSSNVFSRREEMARMQVLLLWLYDALSLSPSSCIYLRRCAKKNNDSSATVPTNAASVGPNSIAFVRRSNTITARHASNLLSIEPYDQRIQQELRRIEQHLSHPLNTTSSLLPLFASDATEGVDCETENEDEPSFVQCCIIQRLMLFLQTISTFSPSRLVSPPEAPDAGPSLSEFRCLRIDLSVLSMQISTLLLVPSKDSHGREDDCFFWDGTSLETILTNVIGMGTMLLAHFATPSTERRQQYTDFNGGSPRRLAHIEYLQRQEENKSFALNESESLPLEENVVSGYMKWIVEAIRFLGLTIWDVRCSSELQRAWMDTKKTASLVTMLLDLLQHFIFPDANLYHHPVTSATISFFHNLVRPKKIWRTKKDPSEGENAEEEQNYYYWCLLLCHHVTDHSTEELWRTAPTAIDVLVQFLHRIVVRQLVDDHLPNASSNTLLVISLIPVRDQIIRLIHRILIYVQNDRRWWDTEESNSKEQGQESKRKKPLSFTKVLSDHVELFKSAAGSILSIPSNDDGIHYCFPSPDIRSMLTIQLNELREDEMEEIQT